MIEMAEIKSKKIQRRNTIEWKKIVLHPLFYQYLVCSFFVIDSVVTILLHPLDFANSPVISSVEALFFLFSLISLVLVKYTDESKWLVYTVLLLIMAYPVVIISTGLMDARMSVHYVPIAFLIQVGQQNKSLSYKAFLIFILILLGFFLSVVLNPDINIDESSIELKIRIILSLLISGMLILIESIWKRARSYYITIDKDLIDQIGNVIQAFSGISTYSRTIDGLLNDFTDEITKYIDVRSCAIYLCNSDGSELIRKTCYTTDPDLNSHKRQIAFGRGIAGNVISEGNSIFIGNTRKDKRSSDADKTYPSRLVVPIISEGKTIGAIELTHQAYYFFNEVHLHLMEIIASFCASKILEFQNRSLSYQSLELEFESQQLQELDDLKSHFIENLSRDIQTPLTLILEPSKKLIENSTDLQAVRLLKLINSNGNQLKDILDQLLELGEIDVTKVQIDIQEIDIGRLIYAWTENFQRTAAEKNIRFSVNGPLTLMVSGDKKKLTSIIHNLVNNALKYTPAGGEIKIIFDLKDNVFSFEVHDSGKGIPEEYREKVFERFFRLGEADGMGTGIGLSIVSELTRVLGGSVNIFESHLGGALFKFKYNIKYVEGTVSPDLNEVNKSMAAVPATDKPLVLVIDDHDDLREFICDTLSDEFTCVQAANGSEGLKLARQTVPDLIITDLMMPEMTGEELCKAVRSDERLSHIPIVVLSAKSTKLDKISLYEIGVDNYLVKPFEQDELKAIVNTLILLRKQLSEKFKTNFFETDHTEAFSEKADASFIEKLSKAIFDNMENEEFSVVMLCELMHLGRNQLQRKVKALTDMTPVEFIRHTRLKEACNLLKTDDHTVTEAAYKVGFNNLSYFTRAFKEAFGCLPSEYKLR